MMFITPMLVYYICTKVVYCSTSITTASNAFRKYKIAPGESECYVDLHLYTD